MRAMSKTATVFAALAAAVVFAAPARGDDYLDASEEDYADRWWLAICHTLDAHHSVSGVMGVGSGIVNDGFSNDSAADIINYAVAEYCPRNWPLLVAVGRAYRGEA